MTITEENAPIVILSEYKDGLALAKKVYARYELYGYVDKDKNVVIPFSFETAHAFKEGMAVVRKDGKYGYINTNGDLVIPCIYYSATDFNEGVARVKINNKYGFINECGKIVIPNIFNSATNFKDGKSRVRILDRMFYIDKNGSEVNEESSKRFMETELLKRKRRTLKAISKKDLIEQSKSKSYTLNNNIKNN